MTNDFVATDGTVNITDIKSAHGLDANALTRETGHSLDELAARTDAEPIVLVDDYKNIVDQRRKALCALGYDIRFR